MSHLYKTCLEPDCEELAEFELEVEPPDPAVGIRSASASIIGMECDAGHTLDDVPESSIREYERFYAGEWADEIAENDYYAEGDMRYDMLKDEGRL